jgi:integrase
VAQVSLGLRPDGKRDRRSFSSKTRGDVEFWLRETTRAARRGDEVDARLTLSAYLDEWLDHITPTVRPTTARGYRIHVDRWIAPVIGSEHLIRLAPADVRRVPAAVVKAGRSPRTAQSVLITLRMALQSAVRDGRLERNVAEGIKAPRQAPRRVEGMTPEQARAILLAFEDHWMGPLVTVAIGTGMRLGELLALRWSDVRDGRIRVMGSLRPQPRADGRGYELGRMEPKTARSYRTLEAADWIKEALEEQRRWQAAHVVSPYVFTTQGGAWLDPRNVTKAFQERLRANDLPVIRFHDLRHAFATISLTAGVSLRVIQESLGHTSIALTAAVYSHVMPELQQDAGRKLEEAIRG